MSYGFTSHRVDGLKGPSLYCPIIGKKSELFFVLEFELHCSLEQLLCFIDGVFYFFTTLSIVLQARYSFPFSLSKAMISVQSYACFISCTSILASRDFLLHSESCSFFLTPALSYRRCMSTCLSLWISLCIWEGRSLFRQVWVLVQPESLSFSNDFSLAYLTADFSFFATQGCLASRSTLYSVHECN